MQIQNVCMIGGAGFVGSVIANRLAGPMEGRHTRVLTRFRERHKHLLVIPNLFMYEANVYDEDVLARYFRNCQVVINLVGILNGKEAAFRRAHVELPETIVRACKRAGVRHLLHMSALGAERDAPSLYQRTKAEGEELVHAAADDELAVTSFRPSVIFGPDDSFFNRFAQLLHAPGPFPLPTPNTRFSPVYVGDVAEAFLRSMVEPRRYGQRYELCGPKTYTLKQLVEYTAEQIGLEKRIWALGDGMSRLQARVLGLLPGQPYSYDNYLSASVDNVCRHNALPEFGIEPLGIEAMVPQYLGWMRQRRKREMDARTSARPLD